MTLHGDTLKNAIGQTREKWGWFVGLGVVLLILGGIAFGNLFIATVASVYVVGWLMLVAGIIEIMHAFGVKTWGRFFYWLLSGLLYAVAGFFAFDNPLLASAVLTFLLAVALVASGALRAWVGYSHRPERGWGWIVAARQGLSWSLRADCGERAEPGGVAGGDGGGDEPGGAGQGEVDQELAGGQDDRGRAGLLEGDGAGECGAQAGSKGGAKQRARDRDDG
jgi:uncharacterized membrane protein HdeD (DUF308 family)